MEKKEHANWHCKWRVKKYREDISPYRKLSFWEHPILWLRTWWLTKGRWERAFHNLFVPFEVIEGEGNLLLNAGIDLMEDLITGVSANLYDSTHAEVGVGNSNTAAAAGQTTLQGGSTDWQGMEGGYPTSASQVMTFKGSWGAGDGNFAWEEWAVRENQTNVLMNRKVESLGTKSGGTWTLEVTITLS